MHAPKTGRQLTRHTRGAPAVGAKSMQTIVTPTLARQLYLMRSYHQARDQWREGRSDVSPSAPCTPSTRRSEFRWDRSPHDVRYFNNRVELRSDIHGNVRDPHERARKPAVPRVQARRPLTTAATFHEAPRARSARPAILPSVMPVDDPCFNEHFARSFARFKARRQEEMRNALLLANGQPPAVATRY